MLSDTSLIHAPRIPRLLTLSLHDALPISISRIRSECGNGSGRSSTVRTTEKSAVFAPMHSASVAAAVMVNALSFQRSEEHTSELQSLRHLVCRLLLEKKKKHNT